jgi:DNA-directed RNA polymerase specialized sigma24 family protein
MPFRMGLLARWFGANRFEATGALKRGWLGSLRMRREMHCEGKGSTDDTILRSAVAALPERQRLAVFLRYYGVPPVRWTRDR